MEQGFAADMRRLVTEKHSFYHKKQKKVVNARAELIASLADQLARRAGNYIIVGNGVYAGLVGVMPATSVL